VLEAVRDLLQGDFSKLAQLRASTNRPADRLVYFEAWLHPRYWNDRALHEAIVERIRATQT